MLIELQVASAFAALARGTWPRNVARLLNARDDSKGKNRFPRQPRVTGCTTGAAIDAIIGHSRAKRSIEMSVVALISRREMISANDVTIWRVIAVDGQMERRIMVIEQMGRLILICELVKQFIRIQLTAHVLATHYARRITRRAGRSAE